MNPFKLGTIVENEFFTDRIEELATLKMHLDSENHIILISPRRFGKSSLVKKTLTQINRPSITINMQQVLNVTDLAEQLLKNVLALYPIEKYRHFLTHFRFVPSISTDALTGSLNVAFQPSIKEEVVLADVMALLENVSTPKARLIVVFDEFQEILAIQKGLDKQLRALMQQQHGLNYILLGSQESMMEDIFERKKSPFYHFGLMMRLRQIPEQDFRQYVTERLPKSTNTEQVVDDIFAFSHNHPYYTQQLASQVWEWMEYKHITDNVVEEAISQQIQEHDLDFERLWNSLNRTDRGVLKLLAEGHNPMQLRTISTSTTYSSLKRLQKAGFVIRTDSFMIEDPFFERWLRMQQ